MQKLVFASNINGTEHTGIINIKDHSVFCYCTKENSKIILEAMGGKSSIEDEIGNRACPCVYLKEPCTPTCTCVNKYSSYGCQNCCTYGSVEQRTKMAEDLNSKVYPSVKPPDDFKEVTGFDTPKELAAYEKGREHEQSVIMKYITDWDGHTNSAMGQILNDKLPKLTPSDDEVRRVLQNHTWSGSVHEKDFQSVVDRMQKLFTGRPLK